MIAFPNRLAEEIWAGRFMLGLRYDTEVARLLAADVIRIVKQAAYRASVGIVRDKGAFPLYERERYLGTPFVRALPAELRAAIARDGIRNSHLTAIAPAGTIRPPARLRVERPRARLRALV